MDTLAESNIMDFLRDMLRKLSTSRPQLELKA